jgi:DNA-binding NarL/FixJ family response regulator
MNTISVVLADDHSLVRAGIRSLLQTLPNVNVVGEASDGHEALALIESLQPDVAFLDIAMKSMNGLEAAARITRNFPRIKVIILSMHSSEEYVLSALKSGVHGYLLKDSVPTELEIALRAVMQGETYLSPGISKLVVGDYLKRLSNGESEMPTVNAFTPIQLTSRQREILQLVAEGATTKDIAQKLSLSAKTVESHRTELMSRLDIHDIAGLVRYAIRIGLITPDN